MTLAVNSPAPLADEKHSLYALCRYVHVRHWNFRQVHWPITKLKPQQLIHNIGTETTNTGEQNVAR